ncbi:hypothetical protein OAI33_13460, partial [Pirellulaceae bacterium]|nr:hypothetical protein [Pirellulaceae bacterium]
MNKLSTYTRIALLDLIRLWKSTQHHVVIVAGICLPLLLLLGIKSGFIEEMRKELLSSPKGREITFWAMDSTQFIQADSLDQLKSEINEIEVLVPEVNRIVGISNENVANKIDATLSPTVSDDPILTYADINLPKANAKEIVLTKNLAEKLECQVGDSITLHLTRNTDAGRESNSVPDVKVISIFDSGDAAGDVGYCDLSLLNELELYVQGFAAESLDLLAADNKFSPSFSGYLLISKTKLMNDSDLVPLDEFGMRVIDLGKDDASLPNDIPLETIKTYQSAFFTQDKFDELSFYYVDSGNPDAQLNIPPGQISLKTRADDVVVVLIDPVTIRNSEGQLSQLIGMDLPRSTWLRNYTIRKGLPFRFPKEVNQFRQVDNAISESPRFLRLNLGDEYELRLERVSDDKLERFASTESVLANLSLPELESRRVVETERLKKL